MKKYGIKTVTKDSTPGFRDTDITEKWYPTEEERDKAYNYLNRKLDPLAEFFGNKGISNDYIEKSYSKIEKE